MEIKANEKGLWAALTKPSREQQNPPPPPSAEEEVRMEGDRLELGEEATVVQSSVKNLNKAKKLVDTLSPHDADAVATLARTADAAEAIEDLARPLDSRKLDLQEAVVTGDVSGIVKEVGGDTHIARAAGLYGNIVNGGLAKKTQEAFETLQDPNADGTDKAIAGIDAATTAIDTFDYAKDLTRGAKGFIKNLDGATDLASVASKAKAAFKAEAKTILTEGPKNFINGLRGLDGGIADVATKTGVRRASAFATGVNVALAASDVLHAEKIMKSSAGTLQKNLAVFTAAGSVIAATNIPGVSQIGATISFVFGIAESFAAKSEKKTEPPKPPISWSSIA